MPTLTTARRIIPCLDVRDGRVVKGVRFADLRDVGDPADLAASYEAQGADEVTLLDVSATREGRAATPRVVERVRAALGIPLTVGGGVRSADDAARLLDAGADKVSINSAAVQRPTLIDDLASRFGAQFVVLAVDAARRGSRWATLVRAGTVDADRESLDWCAEGASRGAGEILLTSWDRDGARAGYDLDLLRAVVARVEIPVIASGGANDADHMRDAFDAGADAVLAASIFHDNRATVGAVKSRLAAIGIEVRR